MNKFYKIISFSQVLFKNKTDEETPYLLKISSCGTFCTLNDFLNITEPFIINNWEEACKKESSDDEEVLETWPFSTSNNFYYYRRKSNRKTHN